MTAPTNSGQLQEIRRGYPVLIAALLTVGLAMPTVSIYTLPYFMAAFKAEFGWERQEAGVAVSFLTLTIFLVGPWVGRLVDRHGVRRIASVSIVLYAAGLALLSQLTASIWTLYAAYVGIALAGLGASHLCYLRVVATWLEKARGLALGIVGSGAGIWAATVPLYLPAWIQTHGWRSAWVLVAVITLFALPIVLLLLKERGIDRERSGVPAAADGMTAQESRTTQAFWLMIVGTFSLGIGLIGISVQIVPLVTEATGSTEMALRAGSAFGISLMCGRLFTGFLLDRFKPHLVASGIYLLPVLAIAAFASGHALGPVLLGAGIGLAAGGENDILSYLAARYFGLRSFSELFGWLWGTLSLGGAAGPIVINLLHVAGFHADATLMFSASLCGLAAVLFMLVGLRPTPYMLAARSASAS